MSDETSSLSTRYDPKPVEERWYRFWEERGFFHAEAKAGAAPFCIVIPPPNVTGALHMGHGLNNTLQDILVRFRRMQGRNVLWMPGTDHAGIATQNVVERALLAKEGRKRHDIGREAFIERVWAWKAEYGDRIVNQLKRVGSSCDWQRQRFTMDEGLSRAVREAFVRLFERGLIYRGKYLINWCPRCTTALADDEVEHEEREGSLWYIKYPFKDEPRLHVIVATTRPETLLGDTAVAVNPNDERYRELIGKMLVLPVIEREIPIIADDSVDPAFGTGAVKVTPAHDPNDFQTGLRHNLAQIIVMHEDGTMNENAGPYDGMDRYECREALLEELRQKKLLESTQRHNHSVGHCYRCHTVIEPYLSDQWFVKMRPLADAALKTSASGEVRFHPERWKRVYESWLENVRDWCISRQIWWGHRIPAWHCADCGKITVQRADPTECAHCQSANIAQDPDVLDTWFSSSLWPFSTLGWPEKTPELKTWFPTSVLVTDRGIIYFWVARMVMMALQMMEHAPFDDVLIHGTILDGQGRKMSKSLGNGIDPIEVIDQYGADAMRFSLVILTVEGQDVKLSTDKFEMGRNFANKLWNASRFAMMNLSTGQGAAGELLIEDRWILSRLRAVTLGVTGALDGYQLNEALRNLYEFTWREFCDWYLEAVKPRMAGGEPTVARRVLAQTLDGVLRLLHPFMPFITEEIWQLLRARMAQGDLGSDTATFPESLMIAAWPKAEAAPADAEAEEVFALLQDIIRAVRNIRSKLGVPERKPLEAVVSVEDEPAALRLRQHERILKEMGFIENVQIGVRLAQPPASATDVVGKAQVFVPLKGLLDIDAERARLQKAIEAKESYVNGLLKKLSNANFVAKAPPAVVEREKARCAEIEEEIAKLRAGLAELEKT